MTAAGALDYPDSQAMGDVLFLFFQEPITWLKYKFSCVLSYISETILMCTWQPTTPCQPVYSSPVHS